MSMNCKISKKICLLLILFSSIFFGTKVYAADIKATNITLVDKSSTAEVDTPVMVNNEITSKITLNKENDYAVFDLTIKNNEKNKYKIESIVDNNENNYINVSYDYSKDYFQEETKVKIKFLYKNKLINQEKVSMDNLVITIKLVNDKGESTNIIINNPKTGDNISLYIIVLVLGVLGLIYIKKKINFKGIKVGISVLIFAVLLLPFIIFALDRYEIPITFKRVEAKGEFEVYDVMVEGIGIRQVTYGNEIGELPEQARDGYSFNGYEDENGVAVSPDTIVTGPMTVRPMYTVITYNITYDYNGGHAVNPNTYTVENTITLNNPTKKGYTFSGWTGSNGDTLQTEVTISSLTGNLNYVANYSANPDTAYKVIHRYPNLDGTYTEEIENLTGATDSTVRPQTRDKTGFTSPALQDIVINAEGTSELIYTYTRNNYNLTLTNPEDIESAFTTGSYPYETEITVKAKDKQGYTFSKWSDNETAKEYTFELVKDTELYPIYTPNTDTAYTVLHKKQNLDETYTLEETENLTGTTDAEVTPGVKTYTGFTSPSTQTVRIKPDGTLVVEYLYTRNRYTLNIEDKDKIEEDKSGEYYYGTEITVVAKDIPGYVFTGWENGGNTKVYTFTLTEDKTIKPLYMAGESTPYKVIHKKMNIDGTTYTVAETENLTGVTDTNVTPNVKTYTGFTSPSTQTVKIKGDGTTVVEYLYTRNQYSLVYVDNDNIDLPDSTAPGDYYYGTEITIKAKEIPGYTFKQWSTGETDNPLTVILEDNLVINPEYIPNKYNVIFDPNTGTGTMDNQQMTYDTEAALSKNLFTKPGYVFKGWNTKADKTGTHYEDEASVKNLVPSGNITLYAEWIEAQAMFETGAIVNTKMKRLAGNSSSNINTFDNNTISIQKSSTKPDISSMTSDNIVSIANTTYNAPIYMWYDNGIIYWWSEDLTPSLNDDSKSMFYRLNGVLNIDVSSFDTSNVTNMSNMFANCTSLTSLDLNSFDTSNVTDMSSMFEFSSNLKTLDISSFNTINVTNMSDMFNVCNNLTNLNVNNFDTSNVTNMSGMFGGCKKLTELDVTHFNTSKVTDMSSMFSNCNDLTELDVTHFNTSKVTDISGMFKNCGSLDTLNVTNFETSNVTDMSLLFYGCSSLTTLDLSHFNTNKVTNMSSMFRDCKNITELDLDNFDTSNVEDFTSLFSGCNNLEYIDLSSFETSKVTGMGFMFSDCKKLTTLDLSHFDTSEVTKMNCMFRRCYNITELDLSSFDTSKVEYIDEMFYNCDNLKTIYASNNFVTTSVPDDEGYSRYMFTGAYELEGGMGTTYSSSHIDKEYAHLDGGLDNPGYFTNKSSINIRFDANGGEGTMDVQTVPYNVSTALNENTFTKEGYLFVGWNTKADGTGTPYLDGDNIQIKSLTTLYAQWIEAQAMFNTGQSVNFKMKKLAGNSSVASYSDDTNITSIQKSTTKPDISSMTSDNIVSISNETYNTPIYMWYDNGIIYWWSEDNNPSLNTDSSNMFYNLKGLTNINLTPFDTSKVTDMSRMFSSCSSLTSLDLGENFDTSNVTNMSRMFSSCSSLTSLDLGENFDTSKVTNMRFMFADCNSLTNLDLSDFDTSNVTDMSFMFNQDSNLLFVDLSSFNTKKVTDIRGMFQICSSLTSLDLSNFDTSNVIYINHMFTGCSRLTSLDLSSFDTSKVTNMKYMFADCNDLTNLNLGNKFDTSNVTDMSLMFQDCSSLTSLDLGDKFDTSKVTNMSSMFMNCSSLTTLDLGDKFDTSNVTDMTSMFYNCSSLTTLDLGDNFDTSNVTNMNGMFAGMTNLITIYAPTSFVTTSVTNSTNMFTGDTKLVGGMGTTYSSSHIDKEYAHLDGGLDNPGYFTNKSSINIRFDANGGTGTMDVQTVPYNVSTALNENTFTKSGYLFVGWNTKADGTGTAYADGANIQAKSVTTLYAQWSELQAMFDTGQNVNNKMKRLAGNASVTFSTVDTNITSIQKSTTKPDISSMTSDNIVSITNTTYNTPIYMWYDNGTIYWWSEDDNPSLNPDSSRMFRFCEALTSISFSSWNTSAVTNMKEMFFSCYSLSNFDFTNIDTSNVTNMNSMFSMIYDLNANNSVTTLDLSKFNTSNVIDMGSMFSNCNKLTNLNLSSFNTSNVTYMNNIFYRCRSLTTLDLGSKFDTSNVTNMSNMFDSCISLTSLDLGDKFDTSNVTNMYSMFNSCISLTSLDLGDKFDTSKVTNMYSMFYGCNGLTSLDLGDKFDTSNVTNMENMFYICKSLTSLDLGDKFDTSKVTNMSRMFNECKNLTSLDLGDKFDTSNVTNMFRMFYYCSHLTELDLGDKFDTSKVTRMDDMFNSCSSLTILELGNKFDTSNVTTMESMFYDCRSLTTLDLGDKFDTSKVTNMHSMFNSCRNLTTLDLGENFDTSSVTDMSSMFFICSGLTTIYASNNFVTTNVTSSGSMFSSLSSRLKGGSGTTWSSSNPTDKTYAHIDGGTSNPGYFTYKAPSTGGNISRFINAFKSNKSIKNTILLIGMSSLIIISLLIVLFVKNKSKKKKVTIN